MLTGSGGGACPKASILGTEGNQAGAPPFPHPTQCFLEGVIMPALLFAFLLLSLVHPISSSSFSILVVDDSSPPRPVPLVLFRSAGDYLQLYTDSAGVAAVSDLDMLDTSVFFSVYSDGYSLDPSNPSANFFDPPYDAGVLLTPTAGGNATVTMAKNTLARRDYRLTGSGLYLNAASSSSLAPLIPDPVRHRAITDDVRVLGQE